MYIYSEITFPCTASKSHTISVIFRIEVVHFHEIYIPGHLLNYFMTLFFEEFEKDQIALI